MPVEFEINTWIISLSSFLLHELGRNEPSYNIQIGASKDGYGTTQKAYQHMYICVFVGPNNEVGILARTT